MIGGIWDKPENIVKTENIPVCTDVFNKCRIICFGHNLNFYIQQQTTTI